METLTNNRKKQVTQKNMQEDPKLRERQEMLIEKFLKMTTPELNHYFKTYFLKEYKEAISTDTSYSFDLYVLMVHQGYRIEES